MTRIVVMDEELHEALTVVEVPASFMRAVEAGHHPPWIWLQPPTELPVCVPYDEIPDCFVVPDRVRLRLERVARGREPRPLFWFAYADNPTLALKLRAAFMPGQIGELQRREEESFWRGVIAAASTL